MKISVIIPTYKPSQYIWECLDSLKMQTINYNLFEIIIILNGCKEPYETLIRKYITDSCDDINFKFIQTNISGVSNARNIGLDIACGEYICFIDDDDYVSASYLFELLQNSTPNSIALSNALAFDDRTGFLDQSYPIHKTFVDSKVCSILQAKKYFGGPCMKMIHRDIINNRTFNTGFQNGEDSLFMFLISDQIQQCRFTTNQAIYYRRYRENSAITTKRPFCKVFTNGISLMWEYTKIMLSHPFKYNPIFYITRILAGLHSWIAYFK